MVWGVIDTVLGGKISGSETRKSQRAAHEYALRNNPQHFEQQRAHLGSTFDLLRSKGLTHSEIAGSSGGTSPGGGAATLGNAPGIRAAATGAAQRLWQSEENRKQREHEQALKDKETGVVQGTLAHATKVIRQAAESREAEKHLEGLWRQSWHRFKASMSQGPENALVTAILVKHMGKGVDLYDYRSYTDDPQAFMAAIKEMQMYTGRFAREIRATAATLEQSIEGVAEGVQRVMSGQSFQPQTGMPEAERYRRMHQRRLGVGRGGAATEP